MTDTPLNINSQRKKFTYQVIFYRILLLGATLAYALSFSADVFLHLHFNAFIIPSVVIAFLFFSVFILSFFVDTINRYFNLLARVLIVAVHFHIIGLSIVNHFRPELLFGLLAASLIASFIFQKIKTLVLFDLTICAILVIGIFVDRYIAGELELLKAPIIRPYIDPIFFLLSEAGVMILAALLSTIRFVQFRNFEDAQVPRQVFELSDDPSIVINGISGIIVDCNEQAIQLFHAGGKDAIVGRAFDSLLKESFAGPYFSGFRNKLSEQSKAAAVVTFISQDGHTFAGILNARKGSDNLIRVSVSEPSATIPVSNVPLAESRPIAPVAPDYLFNQSILPVATLGPDYKFAEVNDAFCDLCGYTKSELKNIKFIHLVHPEDQAREKNILSNLFSGKIPINRSEKRILKKNSRIVWVSMSSSLIRDEKGFPQFIVSLIENISQKKRYEKTLINDKLNLSSVIDTADLFVVNVDRNHSILFLNEKLRSVIFDLTEMIVEPGFNLGQIIPGNFISRYKEVFEKGFSGETFFIDEAIVLTDGKKLDLEISVHPVRTEEGNIRTVTIAAKDISGRKQKERDLISEKQKAENATEAKSGFLATMSHEIRTPLNGVIGMGRLLDQTELNPKQQEYVNSIILSGDALLSVINDILDFSKIESSKMELEKKPFAVKRVVEETFDLMSARAIEKNLGLQYSIQKDVPRYLMGDITRLRQILLNLVSNGIKFTSKGKLTIHVSRIKQEGETVELLFEIKDTGIGIPANKIDRLFKAFSQADASTTKTYGGTGLGLAISRDLVALMGGKIWVDSIPGNGSTFSFTIITDVASGDNIPDGKSGVNQVKNASVLIISDDKTEINIFTGYFTKWGMKVRATDTVEQAMTWIRMKEKFDIVAVDAQMITARAGEVARKIRTLVTKEELPIILFNANDEEITVEFTDQVLSAVIPKNVDRSKLLDMLIGVFAFENHQRLQQERALTREDRLLSAELPIKILVAEDNSVNQLLVKNLFDGMGYKPDIVENGLLVIEKLRAQSYDLIFMDVQMPEMNGLDTTRFIKNKMNLEKVPVIIAMTAFALEGDKEKCLEAGMNDYISKPFMIEEIVSKIRKWSTKSNEVVDEVKEVKPTEEKSFLNRAVLDHLREISPENADEFLREVVNMFLQQAPGIVNEIYSFCKEKRYLDMSHSAHKLKGSSLNIGAAALGEMCRIIEINGRDNKGEDCDAMIENLQDVLDQTALELRKII
ncbi:MAG: response regulator [Bacteroidota bacterium]